jgi:hypothetical protein
VASSHSTETRAPDIENLIRATGGGDAIDNVRERVSEYARTVAALVEREDSEGVSDNGDVQGLAGNAVEGNL